MPEFTLIHADIYDALRELPGATFDTVICDGPYGLSITKNGPATNWDSSSIAFDPALWAELRRVTKPGGVLAAFGHSRTAHRQSVALEDAGWQILDTIAWVKSHGYQAGNRDLEKELRKTGNEALADQYAGFGTHLQPAYEPVTIARNLAPRASLVQAIANGGGAGGLNFDTTRVQESDWAWNTPRTTVPGIAENRSRRPGRVSDRATWAIANREAVSVPHLGGRLPGNLIVEHAEACTEAACEVGCVVAGIDAQGRRKYAAGREPASRFFTRLRYSPRARSSAGQGVVGATHPTEKPEQLLAWLAALIVKPGAMVLDAFAGSGAVSEAVIRAGAGAATAIEREAEYVEMVRTRIEGMGG